MPSTSAKQAKFMRAVAHSPKFAKKVGVSQSVGKDFEMADKKTKKFGTGGDARKPMTLLGRETLDPRKAIKRGEAASAFDAADEGVMKLKPQAKPMRPIKKDRDTLGSSRLAKGGKTMKKADKAGRALVKKSADTMGRAMKMNKGGSCYAKGGSVAPRADGIAKKGHTRGKVL